MPHPEMFRLQSIPFLDVSALLEISKIYKIPEFGGKVPEKNQPLRGRVPRLPNGMRSVFLGRAARV